MLSTTPEVDRLKQHISTPPPPNEANGPVNALLDLIFTKLTGLQQKLRPWASVRQALTHLGIASNVRLNTGDTYTATVMDDATREETLNKMALALASAAANHEWTSTKRTRTEYEAVKSDRDQLQTDTATLAAEVARLKEFETRAKEAESKCHTAKTELATTLSNFNSLITALTTSAPTAGGGGTHVIEEATRIQISKLTSELATATTTITRLEEEARQQLAERTLLEEELRRIRSAPPPTPTVTPQSLNNYITQCKEKAALLEQTILEAAEVLTPAWETKCTKYKLAESELAKTHFAAGYTGDQLRLYEEGVKTLSETPILDWGGKIETEYAKARTPYDDDINTHTNKITALTADATFAAAYSSISVSIYTAAAMRCMLCAPVPLHPDTIQDIFKKKENIHINIDELNAIHPAWNDAPVIFYADRLRHDNVCIADIQVMEANGTTTQVVKLTTQNVPDNTSYYTKARLAALDTIYKYRAITTALHYSLQTYIGLFNNELSAYATPALMNQCFSSLLDLRLVQPFQDPPNGAARGTQTLFYDGANLNFSDMWKVLRDSLDLHVAPMY